MSERDERLNALRAAVEGLAAEEAPKLVAEARAEARAKVRSMLSEAIAESLLDRSAREIGRPAAHSAPSEQKPASRTEGSSRSGSRKRGREAAPKAPQRPEGRAGDGLGYYLYGVVACGTELPADLAGVDRDRRVELIEAGEIAAIASPVSLREFDEEALHENLNDVEWLEATARTHEHVLEVALEHATVVPMRLCTIYAGQRQVHEMLIREHDLFAEALRHLHGRAEWGVKLIAAPGAIDEVAEGGATSRAQAEEPTPGAAYMERKRRQAHARQIADRLADSWADAAHDRLAKAAAEALLNPLQPREVSGLDGDMLLNGVYLVDDERVDDFRQAVDGIRQEYGELDVAVELTGPWPAYNFVKSSIEAAR